MFVDVFVPVLTYPAPTSVAALHRLPELLQPIAKTIQLCAIEILVPDIHDRPAGLVDSSGLLAAAEFESHEKAISLLAELPRRVKGIEVFGATLQTTLAEMGDDAAKLARTHDLTLALVDPLVLDKKMLAEGLIFGSGGPVLVVPETIGTPWDIRHVAIAWDGSRAAARAIHDAIDLLQAADEVSLLTATDDKPIDAGGLSEIKLFLARHDIAASQRDVSTEPLSTGAALQRAAIEDGAGLLVMGAFGHSRVAEFVLGGATRTVLDAPILPILMSH